MLLLVVVVIDTHRPHGRCPLLVPLIRDHMKSGRAGSSGHGGIPTRRAVVVCVSCCVRYGPCAVVGCGGVVVTYMVCVME